MMKAKRNLLERFGIEVKTQPQFINILQGDKYIIINVNYIKKIEPADSGVLIYLIDEQLDPIACDIKKLVMLLPNVAPIEAGE